MHHVLLLLLHDLSLNSCNLVSSLLLGMLALATDEFLNPEFSGSFKPYSILLGDLGWVLRRRSILRHIAVGHFLP